MTEIKLPPCPNHQNQNVIIDKYPEGFTLTGKSLLAYCVVCGANYSIERGWFRGFTDGKDLNPYE
jgi:hypothetical protein